MNINEELEKKSFRLNSKTEQQILQMYNEDLIKLNEVTKIVGQLEPLVSDANGGQWQKCPKCDGQGIVSKPPWIAGDQNTWTASEGSYTCNLCNGQMVIKQ